MKSVNGKRKFGRFALLTALSIFILPGCTKGNGADPIKKEEVIEAGDAIKDIEASLNPEILRFDGVSEKEDRSGKSITYSFMIEDTKGEVGKEVAALYSAFNDALKTPEFQGQRTQVWIMTPHPETGVMNIVAYFGNYDDENIYDHISFLIVNGIDDMTDDYDSSYRYELNDTSFWDALSQAEKIQYSSYVEYQSEIDLRQTNVEQLEEYLMNDFTGFVEFGEMNTVTDGVNTASVEWNMEISNEGSCVAYASEAVLMDAIRQSVNEYYESDPDDEFLNLRLTISFYTEDGTNAGYISNWDTNTKESMGGFYGVKYKDATADELKGYKDIKILDLFGRPIEEVEDIIDGLDGVEVVYVRMSDMKEELSAKYPQIEFR